MTEDYSFCETIAAYLWHIRPLTAAGRKPCGGADSKTLCDLQPSWDINCEITDERLNHEGQFGAGKRCPTCVDAYRALK